MHRHEQGSYADRAGSAGVALNRRSSEIPRLHRDRLAGVIGHADVAGARSPGRQAARIDALLETVGLLAHRGRRDPLDGSTTGAIESTASNNEQIMAEVAASRLTERGATRGDDRVSEAAMEDRKKEGYF